MWCLGTQPSGIRARLSFIGVMCWFFFPRTNRSKKRAKQMAGSYCKFVTRAEFQEHFQIFVGGMREMLPLLNYYYASLKHEVYFNICLLEP
jgi:hypothetical protein